MKAAPVLCAVISSLVVSAPTSSAISSRPEPVVPTPRIRIRSPSVSLDVAQPLADRFDGPRVGAQVDLLEHLAGRRR